MHARWRYDFPLDHALLAAKYHHQFALYRWAVATLTAWPFAATERVTLVPVPLAPDRLAERGYNQATLIAQELAHRFRGADGAPALSVDANAALRIRETAVQQRLNWVERRRNVRGAFAATRSFTGEAVVLIDDVLTTGATLNELARVLTAAGAAQVDALVLARVLPIRRRERSNAFGRAVS
ncbi:MAG: ComF family protein [Burkholderiales bacterium]|nr:ComF family protein [Burkholderiales bacterium]